MFPNPINLYPVHGVAYFTGASNPINPTTYPTKRS